MVRCDWLKRSLWFSSYNTRLKTALRKPINDLVYSFVLEILLNKIQHKKKMKQQIVSKPARNNQLSSRKHKTPRGNANVGSFPFAGKASWCMKVNILPMVEEALFLSGPS